MKKATIKKQTVEKMKSLGVYKPEFDTAVDVYSGLCEQYDILYKRFEDSGFEISVQTSDGGEKKSPIVTTLESLRKDILLYTDRLCLNPKALKSKSGFTENKSALAEALKSVE